ncbi:hypothetical protein HYS28_01060 [Candidatus Uhrbacteria bacterium]|nr:hypothetical protein [Candidatus Uhrbacteria bacterium]
MTEAFTKTAAQIFDEIVERGRSEMITSKEAYDMTVEEVVEEHQDLDEIDIDEDNEGLEAHLKERFADYLAQLKVE